MRAVVLLSGGIDSTCCALMARAEGREIHALSFRYGQRHADPELASAERVAKHVGAVSHSVLTLPRLGGSSLTGDGEVPVGEDWERDGVPSTFVPGRNLVFLSHAYAWAGVLGADEVWIGANAVDYSGYPDCRGPFLAAFERAGASALDRGVNLRAPLLHLTKREIVERVRSLGYDPADTVSCYLGLVPGCRRCDSCQIRNEAGVA